MERLPLYLSFLRKSEEDNASFASSRDVARALDLNEEQVRKDLAMVSSSPGRPGKGFELKGLIADIQRVMGLGEPLEAVLSGAGNLGRALLGFQGFEQCGVRIIAAFDIDPDLVGKEIGGRMVFDADRLPLFCNNLKVPIGIIAVPASFARKVCDDMVEGGVRAIWNLTSAHLTVPEGVIIKEDNPAVRLGVIAMELRK